MADSGSGFADADSVNLAVDGASADLSGGEDFVAGLAGDGSEGSAGFRGRPSPAGFAAGAAGLACSGSEDLLPGLAGGSFAGWVSGWAGDGVDDVAGEPGSGAVAGGFADWLSGDLAAGVGWAEASAEAFGD
ncbi:MAG: hypothetical protein ACRDSK_09605 [Actinophytocola sp.]|uniref:hypothetical protein n=1 Tax=Actinophytocola sp. TaxID=1872138 RepID=UPI003D6AC791